MKSGRFWPFLILSLIGLNFAVVGYTVYAATKHGGAGVEPSYDLKGLEWDRERAQHAANAKLGWTFSVALSEARDAMSLELRDVEGKPVTEGSLRVVAFRSARAGERATLSLVEGDPGTYGAALDCRAKGLWVFRLEARAQGAVFTGERIVEVK
ncbi:MAG: FixH family protein [Planctomycetota bacterium]|nr:FixH family protein [Planctomycetota bacterium]